jgi:acetolactate synthase I/II/III large subunit
MKLTVAEAIVRCLETEGIDTAFGIAGSHYLAFLKQLIGSKIRYISVKHESSAGFMGLFYTKVSQKHSLLLGTAGPGAMNLLNGIAEMAKSEIPAFILTPTVPTSSFGKCAFQEDSGYGSSYSINKIMESLTRKSIFGVIPELIPRQIRELMKIMLSPPYGPVHISIPSDVFGEEIDFEELKPENYRSLQDERLEPEKIKRCAELLKDARKPFLLIGNRCNYPNCSRELEQLIRSFKIPFVLTHASKGLLSEQDDLFAGVTDFFGHRSAEYYLKESDFILAAGMDFSEAETIKYDKDLFKNAKLCVLDNAPERITANYPFAFSMTGNIGAMLSGLHAALTSLSYSSPWEEKEFKKSFIALNQHQAEEMNQETNPLTPPYILHTLSETIEKDTLLLFDVGSIFFSSIRNITGNKNAYLASPTGYSMGQAVSGCIGAKLAAGEKPVLCITGDGSFLMNGMEVLTAIQNQLGITWIIFKDDYYNMVHMNQQLSYNLDFDFCLKLHNPDYAFLSQAFGVKYFEVNTLSDLKNNLPLAQEWNKKNISVLMVVRYAHEQHLSFKHQMIGSLKDYSQTKNISANPHLMRAFKKILREKV